jgi:hypothetical protein
MSAEKKVVTIKGEELPISKCRKFNNLYYKIGDINIKNSGDCYLISGKCYREETGLVVYNYSINQYVLLDNSMFKGIVNFIEDLLITGYFNKDKKYSKIIDKDNNSFYLFNPEIFKNNKEYREQLSSGDFYHISRLSANKFNTISVPNKDYKYSLPYDSKGIIEHHLKGYENYNPEISKNIKNYAPLLENLSFGLEFETTKGFIPNRLLDQYGLIPLRDGSISGIEYVTVPMQGEKGLQCTADILKVLKERTEYNDDTCSLHLHLGNIPRTKEFILAFFKVGMKIQDEMFQMFPLYKKYNYHIKNKNYSAPLPTFEILSQLDPVITSDNIDINFGVLYRYLSMGQDFKSIGNDLNNVIAHPADPNGNQKWNVKPRYFLYNIIPLIFGNKQTIEFRIHTPTYDINKILPFIFTNSLIVNFTIRNQDSILRNKNFLSNYSLLDILLIQIDMYDIPNRAKFRDMMYHYIEKRKNYCENQTLKGNILGTESEIPAPTDINWTSNQEEKKNPFLNRYSEKPLPKFKEQPYYGKTRNPVRKSAVVSPHEELYTWMDSVYSADLSNMNFTNTAYHKAVKEMLVNDGVGIKSQMEKVEPSLIVESKTQPDDLPY